MKVFFFFFFLLELFLLSEHILCKESIVIVKNSTLRFWYTSTFWDLRNSFMLFSRWCMYVYVKVYRCVHACVWGMRVYVCVYVSEHDSV